MGYAMHSFVVNGNHFVAISSPKSSSPNSIPFSGKVEIRDINYLDTVVTTLYGSSYSENFGQSITSGDLFIEVGDAVPTNQLIY
jgi:hypothetical protein